MLGWMDDEALARTLATGRATYWSRSRGSTGSRARPRATASGCGRSASTATATPLLLQVDQEGPACHTGARTCFDADLVGEPDARSEAGHG